MVTGLYSSFPYVQMNKEAYMWGYIVYYFLIQGKHITEVTYDRVCLIYALICDDIEINVGYMIFFCYV